jgi:hypothetical protein
LGTLVVLELLATFLLLMLQLPKAIDHLVDRLAVTLGFNPALAGLFMLQLVAGDQSFLLLNRLTQATQESTVVAQARSV